MKILIFLFAIITFVLMAADPRREDFELRSLNSKKSNAKAVSTKNKDLDGAKLNHDQEDQNESS